MKITILDSVEKAKVTMKGAKEVWKQVPISRNDGSPIFSLQEQIGNRLVNDDLRRSQGLRIDSEGYNPHALNFRGNIGDINYRELPFHFFCHLQRSAEETK